MKLSIVTTLYKSAEFIDAFYKRAIAAAAIVDTNFEIIMVNDGSPDESLALAVALQEGDPRVVVVDLSRNFGHHRAMMTGLSFARGELVFLIDSDLDEDPELLAEFLKVLRHEDCDVVYGIQEYRRGNLSEVITGSLFYWLITRLGGISIPKNTMTARLMTRRYVRNLLLHREREVVIAGLWVATGFKQIPILYQEETSASAVKLFHSPQTSIGYRLHHILFREFTLFYLLCWHRIVVDRLPHHALFRFQLPGDRKSTRRLDFHHRVDLDVRRPYDFAYWPSRDLHCPHIQRDEATPYVVIRHVFRAARASETANQRTQSPKTPAR